MYNFNHFYYFYITAKFKNITKASHYLNISQPSLSSQIKLLEESLGALLFFRQGRKIELTDIGEQIYKVSDDMFKHSFEIKRIVNDKKNNCLKLNIGVSNQIERPLIAECIGKFIAKNENNDLPTIKMINMDSQTKKDEFNFIISHQKEIIKNFSLSQIELPVVLLGTKKIISKNGHYYKNLKLFLKNYTGKIILPTEGSILRSETDTFLEKEKIKLDIAFESDNMAANIRAISEGVGIGFFPLAYATREIKNNKIDTLYPSGGFWRHQIYLYKKNGEDYFNLDKLITFFLDL